MRGKLFIKVFVGFWLVSVTVLGSWMLASEYFDSRPHSEHRERGKPEVPPHRLILRLIYGLQNADNEDISRIVERAQKDHGIDLYLLNKAGEELLGHDTPPEAINLAEKLRGSRRRAFEDGEDKRMSAHSIYREKQGHLRLVIVIPKPKHKVLGLLGDNPWLRLLLAVIISGLACYVLSRLVTNRLHDLQQASRKLASGDLDTRLMVRERGGDETDELARDFNSMAGELQQRILAQKQLLSDVSHELRSPIARLRVALALAEDHPENCRDYLERIERETRRLEELIAQLLSSQQENREMDKHIDLVELLRQLCNDANFEGEQESKRVSLTTGLDQAVIASTGDLLHKSFENIIRNALRHTAKDSSVEVTLSRTASGIAISVEDQGAGVPEDQLNKLFEEFYRVDNARTRQDGGHGLGLAIARRAIEVHGGEITATNTGNGLLVRVNLPLPA